MQLFYAPDLIPGQSFYDFPQDEAKHLARVLRKKEGDRIFLTNGQGILAELEITLASPKKCEGRIVSVVEKPKPQLHLHLAVAPTKMNDRYEWFLEKATEIGIQEITPIICERSERKTIKHERYQKIVVSAMKQSLQCYLPKLNPAMALTDFLNPEIQGVGFIAHCEEQDKTHLKHQLDTETQITLLIGPEGDFSEKEIAKALEKGYFPTSLGENRLRTETAALYACQTVNLHFEP
ncbi:16S rRNA (uracil(1498)-N(3))-methyltransferase [Sediminicola luteus]|uniref:Ribosomal RNA small subunit methyltransferase E n=1 Tax=Sediminicola luteus TaxID=319238 RepID=A0A2A4G1L2_9FLAO|nr:16S rRNA (uracil(1498)-N(3))-methyltransferase [Sediminicola luteus]PCE62577.1 16S rRNA (uracil(1498)-N(3))-methyltransferase [Sediminicola luteus]